MVKGGSITKSESSWKERGKNFIFLLRFLFTYSIKRDELTFFFAYLQNFVLLKQFLRYFALVIGAYFYQFFFKVSIKKKFKSSFHISIIGQELNKSDFEKKNRWMELELSEWWNGMKKKEEHNESEKWSSDGKKWALKSTSVEYFNHHSCNIAQNTNSASFFELKSKFFVKTKKLNQK